MCKSFRFLDLPMLCRGFKKVKFFKPLPFPLKIVFGADFVSVFPLHFETDNNIPKRLLFEKIENIVYYTKTRSVWVWFCVTYEVWTWEQKMSTQCRNSKHCVDLHTSTQCFHEIDILNFLKSKRDVVICLKMEENIKRKYWDEIRPKNNLQWKWQWFKEFYTRTKECPHSICKTRLCVSVCVYRDGHTLRGHFSIGTIGHRVHLLAP